MTGYPKEFLEMMEALYPGSDPESEFYGSKYTQYISNPTNFIIAKPNNVERLVKKLKHDYESALSFGDICEDDKGAELIREFLKYFYNE